MKSTIFDRLYDKRLDDFPENSWKSIFGIYFAYLGLIFLFAVLFILVSPIIIAMKNITFGLINEVTFSGFFSILSIWLIITFVGDVRSDDIRLSKSKFKTSMIVLVCVWLVLNLVTWVFYLLAQGSFVLLNDIWADLPSIPIGYFLAHIFAVGLIEEFVFRGYFLMEITKKMKLRFDGKKRKTAFFLGILISNAMFSLLHIPNRIINGTTFLELILNLFLVLGVGVFLSFTYWFTDNIFMAMIFHGLLNYPMLILAPIFISPQLMLLIGGSIFLIIWFLIKEKLMKKGDSEAS